MECINELLNQYGYIVLFLSLLLEMIAFPLPGEVLMSYSGFLVFQGKLNWGISILFASAGTILGMTFSYWIGRTVGFKFFEKYGIYIHLGPEKLEKASNWFERYGNKLLIIAYFIPGVRHITGYSAGITKISYRTFALNAYSGAIIWAITFISLGKALGKKWNTFHTLVSKYLIVGSLILGAAIVLFYLYKNHKSRIMDQTLQVLNYGMKIFHSLGRIKVAVASVATLFLGFLFLFFALIEDYLANEFKEIDTIGMILIKSIFPQEWFNVMKFSAAAVSLKVVIPVSIGIFIWILVKDLNPFLETRFLIVVVWGGELLAEGLRHVFQRVGPPEETLIGSTNFTFPSEQAFIAVALYGFATFMILRHAKTAQIKKVASIVALFLCSFAGISTLFFELQFPSDVVAGYVFGGGWLSLNIVLLEIFRVLPKIKWN